ncbi:cell division control protein 4 [Cyathus striatus]|nr:cell division control protein 4 [Cyathus striatus]
MASDAAYPSLPTSTTNPWFSNLDPPHISVPTSSSVVTRLLLTHDRIITASDAFLDGIAVFSATTGVQIHHLRGHQGGVWCLAVFEDTLVSGSTDRTVRVWDLNTGKCTHVFAGHNSTVRALVIAKPELVHFESGSGELNKEMWPEAPLIITGSRDHTLRVWALPCPGDPEYKSLDNLDAESEELQMDIDENPFHRLYLQGHDHAVRDVAAYGKTIVSGSYDSTVRVWDAVTGKCEFILRGHSEKVYNVAIDPIRPQAYSSGMDRTVRIWNLRTGDCAYILTGHTSLVGLISISQRHLISAGADGKVIVWNPETGELIHTLAFHEPSHTVTCFEHDDTKVVSAYGGEVLLWDIKNGKLVKSLLKDVTGVWQLAFNERRCVAVANVDDATSIHIWDIGSGAAIEKPDTAAPNVR